MRTPPDSASAASAASRQVIADLRRQLAERTAERDEGLAREAATAGVLGVINSSAGDLARVFDAILEKAHSLCDIAQGALALYDGRQFRVVALHGYAERLAAFARQPFAATPAMRRLATERRRLKSFPLGSNGRFPPAPRPQQASPSGQIGKAVPQSGVIVRLR